MSKQHTSAQHSLLSLTRGIVLGVFLFNALATQAVAAGPCTLFFDSGYHDNQGKFHPLTHKDGTCNIPQSPSQLYQLGALYVTFSSTSPGIQAMQRMDLHDIIESRSQPFVPVDMPETFRIDFDEDQWTNSAMMLYLQANFPNITVEEIPQFGGNATTNDPKRGDQWYLDYIGLDQAKQYCGANKKKIDVAIIDNAFQSTHADLAGSVTKTIDVSDGGSDVAAIDKSTGREHGTLAAGLLAAASDNQVGVAGVSDNSVALTLIKAGSDEVA